MPLFFFSLLLRLFMPATDPGLMKPVPALQQAGSAGDHNGLQLKLSRHYMHGILPLAWDSH